MLLKRLCLVYVHWCVHTHSNRAEIAMRCHFFLVSGVPHHSLMTLGDMVTLGDTVHVVVF